MSTKGLKGRTPKDLAGLHFGRLLVLERRPQINKSWRWLVRCVCGIQKEVYGSQLTSGSTNSCGCGRIDAPKARARHGHNRKGIHSPTYRSWTSMTSRCSNPKDPSFMYYGERGVSVCERWREFENFLHDMGVRPPGKTIDRLNSNGNYEPGNCRWATPKEQIQNRRQIRWRNQVASHPDAPSLSHK